MNLNTPTQTQITCETNEEHSHPTPTPTSTTIITSSLGQAVPISGVSGAVYAPMDTTPQAQTPEQSTIKINLAVQQVTRAMENLVNALRTAENPQANLEEAVNTTLEQAEWFDGRVSAYLDEKVEEYVNDKDFDYEIGNQVERYMRNEFDANDHVDFRDIVADRVDDLIDDIVSEKVEEAVEARLSEILEEKLANANITINF